MTDLKDLPPPAVGAYWIDEGDYPTLLRLFADGNTMPRTWTEWLKTAEEMEKGLQAYTFPDWCAYHRTSTGREGRKKFVAAASPKDTAIKTEEPAWRIRHSIAHIR